MKTKISNLIVPLTAISALALGPNCFSGYEYIDLIQEEGTESTTVYIPSNSSVDAYVHAWAEDGESEADISGQGININAYADGNTVDSDEYDFASNVGGNYSMYISTSGDYINSGLGAEAEISW